MSETSATHPRIVAAAEEFSVDPERLAIAVKAFDRALMGDSLNVERGLAAALNALDKS